VFGRLVGIWISDFFAAYCRAARGQSAFFFFVTKRQGNANIISLKNDWKNIFFKTDRRSVFQFTGYKLILILILLL
jgi:hypothetical protein